MLSDFLRNLTLKAQVQKYWCFSLSFGLGLCAILSKNSRLNPFILLLPPSHFFCHLFHFEMSQNIIMFLKIKVINLVMFLLYPY